MSQPTADLWFHSNYVTIYKNNHGPWINNISTEWLESLTHIYCFTYTKNVYKNKYLSMCAIGFLFKC